MEPPTYTPGEIEICICRDFRNKLFSEQLSFEAFFDISVFFAVFSIQPLSEFTFPFQYITVFICYAVILALPGLRGKGGVNKKLELGTIDSTIDTIDSIDYRKFTIVLAKKKYRYYY